MQYLIQDLLWLFEQEVQVQFLAGYLMLIASL